MLTQYLKKAPTLIVIGVTGFVAYSVLLPGGDSRPPKVATKPNQVAKPPTAIVTASMRDPFQLGRTSNLDRPSNPAAGPGEARVAGDPSLSPSGSTPGLAEVSAEDDKILQGMKLSGTFIDGREQLALIDNKVYARGDQLRGADGSMLPYFIAEVRKDRAMIRRGRRDFEIAFSNIPRTAGPRAAAPAPVAVATAQAKGSAKAGTPAQGKGVKTSKNPTGPGANPTDSKDMLLKLLSGLAGSSGSNPLAALGSIPGMGSGSGSGSGSGMPNPEVNQATIAAGLDAIMGKLDNVGKDGTSAAGLGTTP